MACFGFQSGLFRNRSSRILQATGIVVYGAASSSLSWSINDIPSGKSLTKDRCYGMGLKGEGDRVQSSRSVSEILGVPGLS